MSALATAESVQTRRDLSPRAVNSIVIMGTPVSSGNRGVLALASSLVRLSHEEAAGAQLTLLLEHRDTTPVRVRVGGREVSVPIVHARMSPRCHPRDHFA